MYDKLDINVPYLQNIFQYDSEMKNSIDNDISLSTVSTAMQNYNGFLEEYLKYRVQLNANVPTSELDKHLVMAYESNHEAMKELLSQSTDRYKNAQEFIDHIKDSNKNNSAALELLANEQHGLIAEIDKKIKEKEEEEVLTDRMLEISTYYSKKYRKQQVLMRNIVIILGVILFTSLVFKMNMISERVFVIRLGIIFAFMLIYICYELWDISLRSPINFDEYDMGHPSSIDKEILEKDDIPDHLQDNKPKYCKTKK